MYRLNQYQSLWRGGSRASGEGWERAGRPGAPGPLQLCQLPVAQVIQPGFNICSSHNELYLTGIFFIKKGIIFVYNCLGSMVRLMPTNHQIMSIILLHTVYLYLHMISVLSSVLKSKRGIPLTIWYDLLVTILRLIW